jgi:MerR family transcriptional regulator/heat shock protein HspR
MISAVAEIYDIHPQTLRLYERAGLIVPSRSRGNTRLYTPDDLQHLEVVLHLTRDLGVNLAGVEVILNMRQRMDEMQREMQAFADFVQKELLHRSPEERQRIENALVRVGPPYIVRSRSVKHV